MVFQRFGFGGCGNGFNVGQLEAGLCFHDEERWF
jgi:hypothetical protein